MNIDILKELKAHVLGDPLDGCQSMGVPNDPFTELRDKVVAELRKRGIKEDAVLARTIDSRLLGEAQWLGLL